MNDWLIGQLQPWQWVVLPWPLPRVQVKKTYLPSCILVNIFFNKFLCTRQSMKLTLPVFWFEKEHLEEPLRSFVKRKHRRPATLAGCDSFSFIRRASILQVSFPCRLHLKPARYAETGSVSEEDTSTWRRSSVTLLHHQVFKPAVIEIYAMHNDAFWCGPQAIIMIFQWDSGSGPSEQDLDSLPREPRLRWEFLPFLKITLDCTKSFDLF